MMLLFISLLITCTVLEQCIAIKTRPCNNFEGEGTMSRFEAPICPGDGICQLPRNSRVDFTVDFTPSNQYHKFFVKINATFGISPDSPKFTFPYLGFDTRGCSFLKNGDRCPLEANKIYTYQNAIEIKSYYPKNTDYEITFAVMGKKKGYGGLMPIACTCIDATVVD